MTERHDPLFRAEAVRWARGTRPGDPARLDSRRTRALFRLLMVLVVAAGVAAALVPVPATVSGAAVWDGGRLVATVPDGSDVEAGDPAVVSGGTGPPVGITVAEIARRADGLELVCAVPVRDGGPRATRIDVVTGTEPLLATLLGAFSA